MKYTRFEDLPVWRAASDLFVKVEGISTHPGFVGAGDLRDQLLRAALSVSNNIAEGYELGTTEQLITFLYYARGSAGEVRSMLRTADRLPRFADLRGSVAELILLAESCSRQIQGWAASMQNSEIKGARYLTDAGKAEFQRRQTARAFVAHLERVTRGEASAKDWPMTQGEERANAGP